MKDLYFEWLINKIDYGDYPRCDEYSILLRYLYSHIFWSDMPMDENRIIDGMCLRDYFLEDAKLEDYYSIHLLEKNASILEVMLALSIRCERSLSRVDYDDRTAEWFWDMVVSLGLIGMDDDKFDLDYVERTISLFLCHKYRHDGKGGLFTIQNPDTDMTKVELWYQLQSYLYEKED